MSYLLVLSTVDSVEEARTLASKILRNQLAACITVSSPVESHYEWKGEMCREREYQLFIKTRKVNYARLERFIKENHSYETPEVIAVPIEKGSRDYLQWVSEKSRSVSGSRPSIKAGKAKQR